MTYTEGARSTIPWSASTPINWPLVTTDVASWVKITAGIPYSRATNAACWNTAPWSSTSPPKSGNMGVHAGPAFWATSISPLFTLGSTMLEAAKRARPTTLPGDALTPRSQVPSNPVLGDGLGLAYSKHLCTTCRAYPLSGWPAILHSYSFRILHFPLSTAFHTIGLHLSPPFFTDTLSHSTRDVNLCF